MNCGHCNKPIEIWDPSFRDFTLEGYQPKYWLHMEWIPMKKEKHNHPNNIVNFCSPDCSLLWEQNATTK